MRRVLIRAAVLTLALAPLPAGAAESWGLPGERAATFTAKVVDVQCVLTGDCPRDCGGGRRQLGLQSTEHGLVLAMKSATPFAGAVRDLLPHCGRTITVDGLFAENEGTRVFALQRLKPAGGQWIAAERFAVDWAKADNSPPDGERAAEWYLHDAVAAEILAADGKLGLGPGILPKE